MAPILIFLFAHWFLCVFCQTFFLHRYGAHRMFTMSKGWERFFHLLTYVAQGSSYLNPRGYAVLHREHHAYSDTENDPHSPHFHRNVIAMMKHTLGRYQAHNHRTIEAEAALRPTGARVGCARSLRPELGVPYPVHGTVHGVLRAVRARSGGCTCCCRSTS